MVTDPPAVGRTVYRGLQNVAFLHERPLFRLSDPPVFEALLDSLEVAQAQLENYAKKRAQGLSREEMPEDAPAFCRRGHFLGIGASAPWYCSDCGAPSMSSCPQCGAAITPREGDPPLPPSFCHECGAAFPWVDRAGRIFQLENLLAAEGLDEATELEVRELLEALIDPTLSDEEQRERWQRVRRLAPGLWRSGRTILEGLVGAAIRSEMGL